LCDLKHRMPFIKENLAHVICKRELNNHQRKKLNINCISYIHYTNAGETTLFNLLTSEHKETSSSLFAPPWTTTKCLKVDDQKNNVIAYRYHLLCEQTSHLHNRGVQHWRSGLLQIWFYLYDSSEALQDIGINNQAISKR
jgi:hypothetical protein